MSMIPKYGIKEVQCKVCLKWFHIKWESRRKTCDSCKKRQNIERVKKSVCKKNFPSAYHSIYG